MAKFLKIITCTKGMQKTDKFLIEDSKQYFKRNATALKQKNFNKVK